MAKPAHPVQRASQIQRQHRLQVLFDPSLTGGGGGSEGASRVCVCGRGEGLESELELGDGRKQQMVQLRTNRCRTCSDKKVHVELSDE